MRKVIFWMGISLDGYFEGPAGELDWHCVSEELHQFANDHLRGISLYLNGRIVHNLMADFWPTAAQTHPDSPTMVDYADIWLKKPKWVYSRTLETVGWNSQLKREIVPADIEALKSQPGGDMAVAGANLGNAFMRLGLVDEWWIFVHPVILGRGRRLFEEGAMQKLRLIETKVFGNGVVLMKWGKG